MLCLSLPTKQRCKTQKCPLMLIFFCGLLNCHKLSTSFHHWSYISGPTVSSAPSFSVVRCVCRRFSRNWARQLLTEYACCESVSQEIAPHPRILLRTRIQSQCSLKKINIPGVLFVAQWLMNPSRIQEDEGSIPGLVW